MNNHLLIVDPQNDFCDLPQDWWPGGGNTPAGPPTRPQLPVAGAHADLCRLAGFITAHGGDIDAMTMTLDSHHRVGIERPGFWRTGTGADVDPFTTISAAAVRAGEFAPRRAQLQPAVLRYLDALEAAGRYSLMIWPAHCEIGTWGHNVHAAVHAACNAWEEQGVRQVGKVLKGMNPLTEHYSAVQAEVPVPSDPASYTNQALLDSLRDARRIIIAGEAGSHCVRATTEHLLRYLPPGAGRDYVLLVDCTSPVSGFEAPYREFLDAVAKQGVALHAAQEADAFLSAKKQPAKKTDAY
jgi:nicotinamidase-related amidase